MDNASQRARKLAGERLLPEYIAENFLRRHDAFDPVENPDGYVSLCVAENKLVADLLLPKMAACRDAPPSVLHYDDMVGSARLRARLARFLGRTALGRAVDPHHVLVLNGAGSVLDLLFLAIGDPGDGVLVPTPSYAGFWMDIEGRADLRIVPVHCSSADGFALTTDLLDQALANATRPVKALLFTSPNNPLGRVYSAKEVETIVDWCTEREIHAVFDEIYALSVFGDQPFTSVAQLRATLGDFVHIVWAFSKDFGSSGLRCGVLITENETIRAAIDALAYWSGVSGYTQHMLAELIADTAWVDGYIEQMRRRLGAAYTSATRALDDAGIGYVPAQAGFFFLADLRDLMDEVSWDGEERLWRRLLEDLNVNITPGSACRNDEPGFMRVCFAAAPIATTIEGVRRISTLG